MPILGKNGLLKGKGKKSNVDILKNEIVTEVKECKESVKESVPKTNIRKYIKF
jgi:hypothetical protein